MSELPRAINFLTKPPYEPGDKPCFDKGRFKNSLPLPSSSVADFDPSREDENEFGVDELIRDPAASGASGAILSATWQGGNKSDASAKVTRPAKSYKELVEASEKPILPHLSWSSYKKLVPTGDWDSYRKDVAERYAARWRPARESYGDMRVHGKFERRIDVTYAEASRREREAFLHGAIDKAAPIRRRQVVRRRATRLLQTEQSRRQPKRLLYLLKQPRTLIEARILIQALTWLLAQKLLGVPEFDRSFEKGNKPVNCVSEGAIERSKENDKREPPKRRRHVFPSQSEELDLARRAKDDPRARDKLLSLHWPLVHGIAKKHATEAFPLFDLIQEGFIGLTKCFDQFDPERGFRFSTFAMEPVDWAIKDYKRQEEKKDLPLLDASFGSEEKEDRALDASMIANAVDVGSWTNSYEATPTRTSRIIRDCADRMTVHISPYENGLAPETRDVIAELNAEAAQEGLKVTYIGLANKIEVAGDIKGAAQNDNLGGWFLRRALNVGYSRGEEGVLRKGNSQWRKQLRKIAKRK